MVRTGIILLYQDIRAGGDAAGTPEIMNALTAGVKSLLPGDIEVRQATVKPSHRNMAEVTSSLAASGARRIITVQYSLFPGQHATGDTPAILEKLKENYPEIQFITIAPPEPKNSIPAYIVRRIESAVPEIFHGESGHSTPPHTIERQSMAIIEKLLPAGLKVSGDERKVVKRIVHATGDPEIAGQIRFHPEAISAGLAAIRSGKTIFTDVRMVEAGISRNLANRFGCSVSCALTVSAGAGGKADGNHTRSAAAFVNLGEGLNGNIIAIGNAPTALLALVELIDKGVRPALVIGMPVGFVQAEESKEKLSKRNIPYIIITGRRGGSPVAAAAMNALLRLATEIAS